MEEAIAVYQYTRSTHNSFALIRLTFVSFVKLQSSALSNLLHRNMKNEIVRTQIELNCMYVNVSRQRERGERASKERKLAFQHFVELGWLNENRLDVLLLLLLLNSRL